MILVYSLGGSILAGRDAQSLREYADALKQLSQEHKIFVVVGGGRIARDETLGSSAPAAAAASSRVTP